MEPNVLLAQSSLINVPQPASPTVAPSRGNVNDPFNLLYLDNPASDFGFYDFNNPDGGQGSQGANVGIDINAGIDRARDTTSSLWGGIPWDTIYTIYWTFFAIIILLLVGFIVYYAYQWYEIRQEENARVIREIEEMMAKDQAEPIRVNVRWEHVVKLAASFNEADWRYAIIEADSMLDDLLIRLGFQGESLGDRLRNVSHRHFPKKNQAWTAHKVRNRIAHESSQYKLTKSDALRTLRLYEEVFKDVHYI